MDKDIRRGYFDKDEKEFQGEELLKIKIAAEELFYLLNKGYQISNTTTFIGNHYMLSQRQRLALLRSVSPYKDIIIRNNKEVVANLDGCTINIDGFNTIITLEVGLSGSLLLKCMDNTIRDLAGLRGTYRIIDKTKTAVRLILSEFNKRKVKKINFYLDAPVSNSGRLKTLIAEIAEEFSLEVNIEVMNDVDRVLEMLPNVVTSDAIILNKCQSWINLNGELCKNKIKNSWLVDLSNRYK
ncbi:MAG: hypothetical protein K0R15_2659 [Clostridiales bacterium]|jgi:hypothetical protein|nr:hypothetical protein [Clostridiales bacterium]